MKDFKGKVAVVTGGASGIGRAMAEKFASNGMKLVLADIEQSALDKTAKEMRGKGAEVLPLKTNVANADEMESLLKNTLDAFGKVHIVCNNAGVASAGLCWERTLTDWEWVLGVNLWGVIHGIRLFVPQMLKQGEEGHVVNTASLAGMISGPGMATYNVTKHGVVTLSETLFHELAALGSKVKVSVLCPAWVNTKIGESERNRPAELANDPASTKRGPMEDILEKTVRQLLISGLTPEEVAGRVFDAIENEKFYILMHPQYTSAVKSRFDAILEGRNPVNVGIV